VRSIRWRNWFPVALILSAITIVAGWLVFSRRLANSRTVVSHPPAEFVHTPLPELDPIESLGVTAPAAMTAPRSETNTQPVVREKAAHERALLIVWFVSLAVIALLASFVLRSTVYEPLNQAAALLVAASGAILLVLLITLLAVRRRSLVWPAWTWRFVGLTGAGFLSLTAAHLSFNSPDPAVTLYQAIPLWIAAVAGALIAAWPRRDPHVPDEPPATRWEVLLLVGLTLLALVLRLVDLQDIPFSLYGDETIFAVEARHFNQLTLFRPFTTAMHGNWGLFYMILGIFMRLFGETAEGIRLHSVLFGALTIITTYALARALWGRRVAIIAAALLATYHFHIHFSRSAMMNTSDTLFLTLTFGLVWLGWSTQRRRPWLLGALALGLAQCFYVGGRTILLLLAVMGLFWLITDRARVKAQALNISLAVGVFAVVVVPIFYFAYLRPDDYMTRFNQMLIFRNGWLEAAMQAQHAGMLQILWQQFSDALRLFVNGPDGLFYRGQSLLTPVMTLLTAGGLLYLFRHIKESRAFLILSALGLIILTAGVFTLDPGSSGHHYVGTAPLIYITIAVFIDWALRALERRGLRPRLVAVLGTALVISLMIFDAYYYFGMFVPRRELVSNDVEPAMELGAYLHQLEQQAEPPGSVLCIRQPAISCRHSTVLFLAPHLSNAASDLIAPPTIDDLDALPDGDRIIIVGTNLQDDLALVQAHFPAVTPRDHYGIKGEVLFTSFEIPASER